MNGYTEDMDACHKRAAATHTIGPRKRQAPRTSTTSPRTRYATALVHRWPSLVGILAAVVIICAGADRATVALVIVIAATCYVAAAAFAVPWMAWTYIPLSFVVVFGGSLVGLDPIVATAAVAAVLAVVGLLRGATRSAVTLETAGFMIYGATTIIALLLAPRAGLVVVALTLVAHAVWDVWHLRRHRDIVSPSLAEACAALDVLAGLAVLVVALT